MTLTGPGGVGKTRLALQAAAPGAVAVRGWGVAVRAGPGPRRRRLDDAVAAVFSVTARAGQGTREALVEFLRGKQLLLVLDNCEHLLEAAAALAGVLAAVVRAAGDPGDQPGGPGDRGRAAGPGAAAGAARRRRRPGGDHAGGGGAAVRRARGRGQARLRGDRRERGGGRGGGPAAGWDRAGGRAGGGAGAGDDPGRAGPAAGAQLRGAGGRPARRGRHVTRRCGPPSTGPSSCSPGPEQALLARLAVFAGGCTLEAAEAVCGGDGIDPDAVFELLASLVARSLVVAEEHGLETRYRLLETIRQYGEQRLDAAGEAERWRARHAGYYADLLGQVRRPCPRPSAGGVLGGAARRRAGQPARGVVMGDRHRQRRHRV